MWRKKKEMTFRAYQSHVLEDFKNLLPKDNMPGLRPVGLWIQIGKKYCIVPKILDEIPTGAFEDAAAFLNKLKDNEKEMVLVAPIVVSIFLQPYIDGKYDYDRAIELSDLLMDEPAWKVLSLFPFFLICMAPLSLNIMSGARLWVTHRRNWKPEPRKSIRGLVSLLPYIPLQDGRTSRKTSFWSGLFRERT